MDADTAKSLIRSSAIITACDVVGNGVLRMQTTFEYPGNEYVDVFVQPQASPDAPLLLTDGGFTVAQLMGFGLDLDKTPKRREFVRGVCEQLGIRREGGEFLVTVPEPTDTHFGPAAVRLGQACVRIADLIVTYSTRLSSTFDDELEEGFDALRLPVEVGVPLRGSKGRDVKVDFVIRGPRIPSAIVGVSAKAQGSAKMRVDATFRKWYELEPQRADYQFVTLLDSRVPYWTDADWGVLEDVSEVFAYPAEADAFRELITNE